MYCVILLLLHEVLYNKDFNKDYKIIIKIIDWCLGSSHMGRWGAAYVLSAPGTFST